jgi:hypothetical protein
MNHPKQAEWVLYLDGDVSAEIASDLTNHLSQCAECRREVEAWQRTIQRLETLSSPLQSGRAHRSIRSARFVLKWGMAAVFLLCAGFVGGRLSTFNSESFQKTVAAGVSDRLHRELRSEMLAAFDLQNKPVPAGFSRELREKVQMILAARADELRGENRNALQELAQTIGTERAEDRQNLLSVIETAQNQDLARYLGLRKDLETVVSVADSDLKQNSLQITQLAESVFAKTTPN